jgi:hypothetical protein
MKGDFSRVSFDARNHYSQVLQQQGRVTLDADPNEQGAILLHLLRTMARDLFGPYGGPADHAGFGLSLSAGSNGGPWSLAVGAGRYYVNGMLCESEGCDYLEQPHFTPAAAGDNTPGDALRAWLEARDDGDDSRFWVYLDAWERHVTSIEHPWLREVALGGPDTCSRSQVVWQVRALELGDLLRTLNLRVKQAMGRLGQAQDEAERQRLQQWIDRLNAGIAQLEESPEGSCAAPLDALRRIDLPELAARIDPGYRVDDPCVMNPESGYRGAENHLYRVEIHRGTRNGARPTFKWSRDNGSVLTAWRSVAGNRIRLGDVRGFTPGAWVELGSEQDDLLGRPGALFRILGVDGDELTVEGTPVWTGTPGVKARRWDQVARGDVVLDEGAVPVPEAKGSDDGWIDLEDGVQVRFVADREYHSGDYWLIPARVASGRVEWREDGNGKPVPQPPRGIEHHYAPLGYVGVNVDGTATVTATCACVVYPMSSCGVLGNGARNGSDTGVRLDTRVAENAKEAQGAKPDAKAPAKKAVSKKPK